MGYWIIVVLIILGGVLVLIAAASIDANDAGEESSVRVRPESKPLTDPSIHAHGVEHQLTQVVFIPQLWFQGEHSVRELDNSDVATELHPVRSSMLSDVAAAVESRATNLRDTITTILVGADDFLAGHSLDSVLNELDRVLDCLARQPAMAVIGSVPDIGPALAGTLSAVPADSITATVAIWNDAIADLVLSYSAEFVDLGAVPVHLENVDGQIPGLTVSAVPDLPELAAEMAGACRRAADRIRSIRAET